MFNASLRAPKIFLFTSQYQLKAKSCCFWAIKSTMGFGLQLILLLWKNYTLKKRAPVSVVKIYCVLSCFWAGIHVGKPCIHFALRTSNFKFYFALFISVHCSVWGAHTTGFVSYFDGHSFQKRTGFCSWRHVTTIYFLYDYYTQCSEYSDMYSTTQMECPSLSC